MSFINKKEEVINIQLTRFGKEAMMKGRYKPVYYRFFDDGIIYDAEWASVTENQNDSEPRIKEAPVSKPQSAFVGVESAFRREYNTNNIEDSTIDAFYEPLYEDEDEDEKVNSLRYPISTSKIGIQKTPLFQVNAMTEPFTGSLNYRTGSRETIPVVQVPFESLTLIQQEVNVPDPLLDEAIVSEGLIFDDGVSYTTSQEYIVFSAKETNVPDDNRGFEIEMFEEISGSLVQLYFDHNDTQRLVEEYFDVLIDSDVVSELLDRIDNIPTSTTRSTIFSRKSSNPAENVPITRTGIVDRIYTSLPSDDDVEDCE